MNKVVFKKLISQIYMIFGILSALVIGFFMYSNALDFTTDNTIGYIKEMFFTPYGESQLVTKETVNVDGGDSSITLTGELNIIQGNIANSTVISQDFAAGTITSNKIANGAVTNAKVGNGAITTNKIKDGEVTGVKVGEEQVLPGKIDKTQDYKFQKLIAGSVSSKYVDPNGTSYVNSVNNEYTFFQNGISNNNVLIGTNSAGTEKLTVNGDIIATNKVCEGSYCLGNKPKEIGLLSEGKWCVVSGGQINCNVSGITFDWTIGTWGSCSKTCGGGTQSRSVVCKSSLGVTVADSNCTGTKPISSQVCNTQVCAVKTILAQNLTINKSGGWSTVLQGPQVNLGGATSGFFLVKFTWQPSIKGSGCPNSKSYARPFILIDGVKNYISAHRDGKNTTYSYIDYKEFSMNNPNVVAGIDVKSTYGNRGSAVNVNYIIYYPTKDLMLKDYPSAALGKHYNGCDNSGVGMTP